MTEEKKKHLNRACNYISCLLENDELEIAHLDNGFVDIRIEDGKIKIVDKLDYCFSFTSITI